MKKILRFFFDSAPSGNPNSEKTPPFNFALAGNPNSGKTSFFNALTGENRYVGNWPGVTVEKRTGSPKGEGGKGLLITDLPGLYSLYAYTQEENISRDFILSDECRAVINIIDGVNIERGLYLTLQLIETGKPVIVAVNMADVLEKRGIFIDFSKLSDGLGIPVAPISAAKGTGMKRLLGIARGTAENPCFHGSGTMKIGEENPRFYDPKTTENPRFYTAEFEEIISDAERLFRGEKAFPRYEALRLFDTGECGLIDEKARLYAVTTRAERYAKGIGQPLDMCAANQKYLFIESLLSEVRTFRDGKERKKNAREYGGNAEIGSKYADAECNKKSGKNVNGKAGVCVRRLNPDALFTHKFLAVPIFFGIMLAVFFFAFGAPGQTLKAAFDRLYGRFVTGAAASLLPRIGVSDFLYRLICEGVLPGVGAALGFLPEIALLFVALSLLEDSGYMARAAFIFDKILRKFGLSGRSVIPMLMGFGCSVPALVAARALENDGQRKLTMAVVPFMSCGARLPVYAVIADAFFPNHAPAVIFLLYILGVAAALAALLIKKFITKDAQAGFIMELPEYRLPSLKNMGLSVGERLKEFVLKAGTVIAAASAAVWIMQNFTPALSAAANADESILAHIGKAAVFIFRPLGFGDWRAVTALLAGVTAKEAVAGTLEILFKPSLNPSALNDAFSVASACSFLIFTLLYTPCVAALATQKKEMQSNKYFAAAVAYQLTIAWLAAFAGYRLFSLIF
ncbi:MAG: ferrous iron transport protein B [Clostridiales bacterium]|jgi:ferrous iron transport protein B|nr:ferrous iron transport protein B [Clostridiales bacterium]